jgi:ribosomal protein S15P/S13E
METLFKDFFTKFPMEFSEMVVIKSIHKSLECAQKDYKKDKESGKYLKYMAKAYKQLEAYFTEKGIDPYTL